MASELAMLTCKGQVTVPKTVRDALGLRQGDTLQWDLEEGVEANLQEWNSHADEEAFADL